MHETTKARAAVMAMLAVASIKPAMAYVDPGTGSMLLQMGLAALAGAMFYVRQLRMALVSSFRRLVLREKPAAVTQEPTGGTS